VYPRDQFVLLLVYGIIQPMNYMQYIMEYLKSLFIQVQ